MARPAIEDLFHSFRFWASASTASGDDPLEVKTELGAQSGFQSITVPEYTMEAVEYREGHYIFTRKFPGLITTADLTFMRGVVFGDTGFYQWLLSGGAGGGNYRADVSIYHLHRTAMNPWEGGVVAGGTSIPTQIGIRAQLPTKGYRQYVVHEAIPTRVKVAADLEAMTSDVSVAEADVAYEYFTVKDVAA